MVNEIELLRKMRDEVPAQPDLSGVERRLAEIRAGSRVRRPRRAYRMRMGLALAGAGALAVAAVGVIQARDGEAPHARTLAVKTRNAATVLESAALVAGRSKAVEIRPDQWFYLKETQHLGGDLPTFEHWSKMDGTKDAVRVKGRLRVGKAEKGPTHAGRTQEEIESLPADPGALLRHFRDLKQERAPLSICQPHCPPEIADSVKVFGAIGWYMKFGPMIPPDTAAAMYRALAMIPNVAVEENVTDGDGRSGIGVVLDTGESGKAYYILDPGDYHYLGMKIVNSDQTVSMSVLGSGIVDEPGQVP
ncbi:CU044_5270 family protein [Nonomuraea sp. NPDC049400]|uniref:CU044_5270 family protein n=1 Tax=Nonomuraea sp. NPDC049400 TaxID=3364352 RepID=UPI0037A4A4B6